MVELKFRLVFFYFTSNKMLSWPSIIFWFQPKNIVTSTKYFVKLATLFNKKFRFTVIHEFGQVNKNKVYWPKMFFKSTKYSQQKAFFRCVLKFYCGSILGHTRWNLAPIERSMLVQIEMIRKRTGCGPRLFFLIGINKLYTMFRSN